MPSNSQPVGVIASDFRSRLLQSERTLVVQMNHEIGR